MSVFNQGIRSLLRNDSGPEQVHRATFIPVEDNPEYDRPVELFRQILESTGGDTRAAWEATGLWTSPATGGKIVREISDADSGFSAGEAPLLGDEYGSTSVDQVYNHPELFEEVPNLGSTGYMGTEDSNTSQSGSYRTPSISAAPLISLNRSGDVDRDTEVFLHELGHGVAYETGMPGGTNLRSAAEIVSTLDELSPGWLDDAKERRPLTDEETSALAELGYDLPTFYAYFNNPGEALSRLIQTRRDMDQEELARSYPGKDLDASSEGIQAAYDAVIRVSKPSE